jgi:hypothetical protein
MTAPPRTADKLGGVPLSPAYAAARVADLRGGALVVGAMTVVGFLLGLVWGWWSPPGPAALVLGGGQFQPDETESFVAGDGRFAVLALATGIAAGLIVWVTRVARGVAAQVAVGLGGLGGALAMAVAGRWTGGGSSAGRVGDVVAHLPLSVHMHGLLLLEAAAAVLVYGMCASFAARDDLGRPEPLPAADADAGLVGAGGQLQHDGGDGDGAGRAEQRQFPPL